MNLIHSIASLGLAGVLVFSAPALRAEEADPEPGHPRHRGGPQRLLSGAGVTLTDKAFGAAKGAADLVYGGSVMQIMALPGKTKPRIAGVLALGTTPHALAKISIAEESKGGATGKSVHVKASIYKAPEGKSEYVPEDEPEEIPGRVGELDGWVREASGGGAVLFEAKITLDGQESTQATYVINMEPPHGHKAEDSKR